MALTSLTYTSFASLDLQVDDLEAIHQVSLRSNALEGITGLLIFNGTRFLQVLEGAPNAIDDLLERLRRDPRHSGLEVRQFQDIQEKCFPDWTMELIRVSASYFEARGTMADRLPRRLAPAVRDRILMLSEGISQTIVM